MAKLLIVIPAYNEEENIVQVVGQLAAVCPQYDYVVVNDGSRASTASGSLICPSTWGLPAHSRPACATRQKMVTTALSSSTRTASTVPSISSPCWICWSKGPTL